jgi:hypothetical protein
MALLSPPLLPPSKATAESAAMSPRTVEMRTRMSPDTSYVNHVPPEKELRNWRLKKERVG